MTGVKDLLESERGVLCIALVVAATLLAVLKIITGEQWLTYSQWIAVTLVASKTVTGAIETIIKNNPQPPDPTVPTATVVKGA